MPASVSRNAWENAAVPLLWTGGWDSTFRLLHLVIVEGHAVQPYYMIDRLHYRPGVPEEQDAMRRIRAPASASRSARASSNVTADRSVTRS